MKSMSKQLKSCLILQVLIKTCICVIRAGEVEKLFDEYYEWKMEIHPQAATYAGYHKHSDKLDDLSLEALLSVGTKCEEFQGRSQLLLKSDNLKPREQYYLKILEDETRMCHKGVAYKGYLLPPVDFLTGIQTTLPRFFGDDNIQKFTTERDYRSAIRRLKKVGRQINQIIDLLKLGIQEGITYSNETMFRVKAQFDSLQVPVESSPFYRQFKKAPHRLQISAYTEKMIEIQNEAKSVISERVLPAFKRLGDFIQTEYLPNLRSNPGLFSLKDGLSMYQGFLEYHTSLQGINPEELHKQGLQEVEDLKIKMMSVAKKLGYTKMNFSTFIDTIRDSPFQQFKSRVEKLQDFEDATTRINSRISFFFGPQVLHDEVYDLTVMAMPFNEKRRSYYSASTMDGERSGSFYINVEDIKALKKYETMSLALHEGNPGHHLMETFTKKSDMPNFLKHRIYSWYEPGATPTYTAFVEGWAQYAEYLGIEMKVYKYDTYQMIGYYSNSLVRSIRLVLDTGIHVYGWSRQKAIDYLFVNSALSMQNCILQIDQYITKPGQAAAYKIGEGKIHELRKKFEAKEGREYNLKAFHWHLLSCLGPIESLEECIDERSNHFMHGGSSSSFSILKKLTLTSSVILTFLNSKLHFS